MAAKEEITAQKGSLVSILIIVLLAVTAAGSYYFYSQYQNVKREVEKLKKNPNEVAKMEAEVLKERVGKLIDLPRGEEPTIATVADRSKLKNQSFFDRAENGDKVLLYVKARKAILFRPKTNKIIEVGTVNVQQNTPTPTKKPTPKPTKAEENEEKPAPTKSE